MWNPFKRREAEFPSPRTIMSNWFKTVDAIEEISQINDGRLLYNLCIENGERYQCPECGGAFIEGPSGGMSTNVKCEDCEKRFNLSPTMQRLDRI